MKHVFISYVRENTEAVDQLYQELTSRGIEVWLDRNDIPGGARWKQAIRRAISTGSYFIACFSKEYSERDSTYMNEELTLAIDIIRQLPIDRAWFIPVKLNPCEIPDRNIGGGETLRDFQYFKLYEDWDDGVQKILKSMGRTVTLANQYSNPRALEQGIKTLQKRAEMILSDTIEYFNGLLRKSKAIKKAKKFLTDYPFRFDGQFTVIDSNRNIVFHDIEGVIGLPYCQFLPDFDGIFKEYVIGKNRGVINWIDFLSSDYVINKIRDTGFQEVNWIRFNTSPFSYFEPWDWYIIVEAHHEIHGLKSNEITNFIDYFQSYGWLVVETLYILTPTIPAEVQQKLIQLLQSTNKYVRRSAASTLSRIGEPARHTVPALIELLGDEDKKVRENVVWALGEIGTSEALKAVEEYEKESQTVTNRVMPQIGAGEFGRNFREMEWHELRLYILLTVYQICPTSNQGVADSQIAEELRMELQEVQDYLDRLELEGYVMLAKSHGPKYEVFLEAEGRIALRESNLIEH